MDPLAEYSFDKTPYHYVSNIPVLLIDPYGLYEIPELIVYGHRPPWWKRMFRKIFGDWQGNGGGTQNSGENYVSEGNGGEGAGIEARDDNVRTTNIDDLLPLLRVPGPLNPGTLDFAKFLKKSSDVYKQTSSETSDTEIIEKSTGTTSEQSSPENQTIVKTFSEEDPGSLTNENIPERKIYLYQSRNIDTVLSIHGKDTSINRIERFGRATFNKKIK